nr:hypothetical protein Ade03nite_33040 [Actinoplanes derwentensis]
MYQELPEFHGLVGTDRTVWLDDHAAVGTGVDIEYRATHRTASRYRAFSCPPTIGAVRERSGITIGVHQVNCRE